MIVLTIGNIVGTMAKDKDLAEIERWLRRTDTKESRLGLLATANARAIERIRDGTARVETLRAVLQFIRTHKNGA
jgi:hypothetical protein